MLLRGDTDFKEGKERIPLASIFFSVVFGIVVMRLMQLQLIRGKEYRQFSENNRINIEKVHALRGELRDRNGQLLASSRPSFDLMLTRGNFGEQEAAVRAFLENDLKFTPEQMAQLNRKFRVTPKYDAVLVMEDIPWEVLAKTKTKNYLLPGVDVVYRPMRLYPHKELGCHLLGYLREVSKPRLAGLEAKGEKDIGLGDFIGVWGVESVLDRDLRGMHGARPIIEDAFGRELGEATSSDLLPNMQKREAEPGKNIYLTVDLEVQRAGEEAFGAGAGAAVALDPKTGDLLAMVSRPCFDLSKFSRNIPAGYWAELRNNPKTPLYDRATQGIYPPGSTFKVVTAAAGLRAIQEEPETIHLNRFQSCQGNYRIGRETKRCWKDYPGHGFVNMAGAISESCDVFFYQLGLQLGVDRIAEESRRFGLGELSGIGINQEQRGIVPTTEWKQRVYKTPWVDGETASVAIGQGFLAVTPLQMARVAAAIANHGQIIKPRIVLKAEDPATSVISFPPVELGEHIGVNDEHLKQIIVGLDRVVNAPSGTAYWGGRSLKYRIVGKTGTAQVVRSKRGEKMTGRLQDHAWFIAFAPMEDPKIAVAILLENGGHGGSAAAPIAKKMIEAYLDQFAL